MKMNRLCAAAAFAILSVLAAQGASAGALTAATGPIKHNGATKNVSAGAKVEMAEGDTVETGTATVTWTSESGDVITIEPGSVIKASGVVGGQGFDGKPFRIDLLFLQHGTATGSFSHKTSVGAAAGWMTAPLVDGKTSFYIDAPEKSAVSKAQFRTVRGDAWVRYDKFTVWLPERHSVVLTVDSNNRDRLSFRTGQQNRRPIDITYQVSRGNTIVAIVPRATSGTMEPFESGKTKVTNDIASLKTGKIVLKTRFAGKPEKTAELGPGTAARIDNRTGDIQVVFTAVQFEILESAIMLTSEFSTLAQSNFTDLK